MTQQVQHRPIIVAARSRATSLLTALVCCVTPAVPACTGISIAPTCPNELEVGESATVTGNVQDPGQVPTYEWTVDPANLGSFNPANAPVTTFTAARAGDAILQLTATDGVYLVQSECTTHITAAPIVVTLRASPTAPVTGDAVVLICESDATVDTFTIRQTSGPTVTLANLQPGRVRFDAVQRGDYGFECVGATLEGEESDPVSLTVTVSQGRGGR